MKTPNTVTLTVEITVPEEGTLSQVSAIFKALRAAADVALMALPPGWSVGPLKGQLAEPTRR